MSALKDDLDWLKVFGASEEEAHRICAGIDILMDANCSVDDGIDVLCSAIRTGTNPEDAARSFVNPLRNDHP